MKRNIFILLLMFLTLLLTAQDKPIITVLDFKTSGVPEREMKSIISLISNSLFKTGKYIVIDVLEREALLSETEFSQSDVADETLQIEIGKQLSAKLIVVGSIDKVGDSLVLTAKILETETAITKSVADGTYSDLNELLQSAGEMGLQLAGVEGPLAYAGSVQKSHRDDSDTGEASKLTGFVLVKSGTFTMGNPGKPFLTNALVCCPES